MNVLKLKFVSLRYDQDGNEEDPIIFPYSISLESTGAVSFREEYSPIFDFLQQFTDNIPDGTPLYSFKTHEDPEDWDGTEIGKLVVVDGCFPSRFGDEKLFFKHQWIAEDIELRPEWEPYYNNGCLDDATIPYPNGTVLRDDSRE